MSSRHVIVACLVAGMATLGYALYAHRPAPGTGIATIRCEPGEIAVNAGGVLHCRPVAPGRSP